MTEMRGEFKLDDEVIAETGEETWCHGQIGRIRELDAVDHDGEGGALVYFPNYGVTVLAYDQMKVLPVASKFERRPTVIEAARWDGTRESACRIVDWIEQAGGEALAVSADVEPSADQDHIAVKTMDAIGRVFSGDWVIRGQLGEFYPCAAAAFDEAYDPIETDTPPKQVDKRPHSRACGITPHEHGPACHRSCPTCHGH